MSFDNEPGDVDCEGWAQPELAVCDLPRMPIDTAGLREAAREIVDWNCVPLGQVFNSRDTDPRLLPHLRRALAERKMAKEAKRVAS